MVLFEFKLNFQGMKRRDFIKVSAAAGIVGMTGPGYEAFSSASSAMDGFDLHPFIKKHPEAVFINLTSVNDKVDATAIYDSAYKLAGEIFVKTFDGKGYPNTTRLTCKPNWTCSGYNSKDRISQLGINTDLNFIEGFMNSVKKKGPKDVCIRECSCPQLWEPNGYTQMAQKNNFDLRDLSSKDFWELEEGDLIFKKIDDGVVFKEVAFMSPMNAPDTFLINMAKFKAHQMGITGSVKNLQGITGKRFHQFCGGISSVFKSYDKRYHQFFHADYLDRISELHKKHVNAGIPRWDTIMAKPPDGGGPYMEQWVQRTLDSYSVIKTGINIVEGIYGRDGDGFTSGPHDGKPMDFMSNNIIFGKDAFRVDNITHWLAGHEPGNFGLFHIGIERGLSDVLDPADIPVYLWKDGQAKKIKLDSLKRTLLLTSYLRKNTSGFNEDRYHMCDEPFDYTSWKNGKISQNEIPSIKAIGTDNNEKVVMEVSVPQKGDVYVDILNRHGELVWRLHADDLEPGEHQVVWDGFASPGLYTMYVKGMGWDAERQMVVYRT
jgi:uncharacterized protein (DUF362 family)